MTHELATTLGSRDEASALEAARESITDLMAIRTQQIQDEQNKISPDAALLTNLATECMRLHQERAALQAGDHAQVARVYSLASFPGRLLAQMYNPLDVDASAICRACELRRALRRFAPQRDEQSAESRQRNERPRHSVHRG